MNRRALPILMALALASSAHAACCYFSAKDKDVNQPGQKAFLTWEPQGRRETFTVQPKFEGDARDFGMVIPTPSQPKLDEMPRDFFKHLALYTILLPMPQKVPTPRQYLEQMQMERSMSAMADVELGATAPAARKAKNGHGVTVLEAGVVGSLDYKIITADEPDGLFAWLKENQYSYSGDQATLKHYIDKKWFFTVMKIDAKQMKQGADGSYQGEITPTRFAFESASLVYPLRITQISVKRDTETLFYVLAPEQMDLKDTWSWAWSYRVMWLMSGSVCLSQKQMTDAERQELAMRQQRIAKIRAEIPAYDTTKLEWSKKLADGDLAVVENPAEHWKQAGMPDLPKDAKVIPADELAADFQREIDAMKDDEKRTVGSYVAEVKQQYPAAKGRFVKLGADYHYFLDREAPEAEVAQLTQLKGHLKKGLTLTKFRKIFLKHEMNMDLDMVPAEETVRTEYFRILPQSPP